MDTTPTNASVTRTGPQSLCDAKLIHAANTVNHTDPMKKHLLLFLLPLLLSACSASFTSVEPFYTSIDQAMNLRAGMTREEAKNSLGVYPFDIMHNQFDGCEVHHYLYPSRFRELPAEQYSTSLTDGKARNKGTNDLYLVFRDNALETFFSGSGKEARPLLQLKDDLMFVCDNAVFVEGPVNGCMDPTAVNYDPDATADNGTCTYCPCGSMRNPWYDKVRKCGEPCITEAEYVRTAKAKQALDPDRKCDPCDIINQQLDSKNGKIDIHLNMDGSYASPQQPQYALPVQPPTGNVASVRPLMTQPAPPSAAGNQVTTDQWGRTYEQNMALFKRRKRGGTAALVIGLTFMVTGTPLLAIGADDGATALITSGSTLLAVGSGLVIGGSAGIGSSKKYKRRAMSLQGLASLTPSIRSAYSFDGGMAQAQPIYGLTFTHTF